MTCHGTEHASDISAHEADARLLCRVVRIFGLAQHALVDVLDRLLERREFDHRVWNLARPEGIDAFI